MVIVLQLVQPRFVCSWNGTIRTRESVSIDLVLVKMVVYNKAPTLAKPLAEEGVIRLSHKFMQDHTYVPYE